MGLPDSAPEALRKLDEEQHEVIKKLASSKVSVGEKTGLLRRLREIQEEVRPLMNEWGRRTSGDVISAEERLKRAVRAL